MYQIDVKELNDIGGVHVFAVSVTNEASTHTYTVELDEMYFMKLSQGSYPPEELVKKSFNFLLERESPEEILTEFNLSDIESYFLGYEDAMTLG